MGRGHPPRGNPAEPTTPALSRSLNIHREMYQGLVRVDHKKIISGVLGTMVTVGRFHISLQPLEVVLGSP